MSKVSLNAEQLCELMDSAARIDKPEAAIELAKDWALSAEVKIKEQQGTIDCFEAMKEGTAIRIAELEQRIKDLS